MLSQLTKEKLTADQFYEARKTAQELEWQKMKSEHETFKLKITSELEKTKQELRNIKIETMAWQDEIKSSTSKVSIRKIEEKFQHLNEKISTKESELIKEYPSLKESKTKQIESPQFQELIEDQLFMIGSSYYCSTFNQKVILLDIQNTSVVS